MRNFSITYIDIDFFRYSQIENFMKIVHMAPHTFFGPYAIGILCYHYKKNYEINFLTVSLSEIIIFNINFITNQLIV